ncbi:MAG: two-component system, OmpR family, sensor kinase [Thermoleophilaceae bacterium]|jgi:signal transduction histidine kinase|nr:two-component system, OmpR family, sensor kinase [Thermoleophilaceae bacterium]
MRFAGLRPRVTLLVAAVVIASVGVAFVAVYRGTSRELEHRSDRDLGVDLRSLEAAVTAKGSTAPAVASQARAFLARPPFRATEHVTFVKVPGRPAISDQPELLGLGPPEADEAAGRVRDEARDAAAFLSAPPGTHIRELPDAGHVRLRVHDVVRHGRTVARLGVGEPTATADRSRDVVLEAFLVAGALAIVVALVGGFVVASRVAAPLRRMAGVAAQVDAGEMGPRMAVTDKHAGEVKILGDAFDHMLARLQGAFTRQADFVADASHELRTPLTVISGQIEVLGLDREPDPAEVHRVSVLVREEVQRMARLVDEMLLLAQAGETAFLHPGRVDVPEFLDELAAGMTAGLGRTIEVGARPQVVVWADHDRMTQALRNLLRNGVSHARSRVVLAATASGDWVRFTVDDDGPGIPEAQREHVFDRFHRLEAGHGRSGGGAGLGLPIVRAIAEAHGGRAWAAVSSLGGAQLVVEIPLERA